jgi:hypothetical protein
MDQEIKLKIARTICNPLVEDVTLQRLWLGHFADIWMWEIERTVANEVLATQVPR